MNNVRNPFCRNGLRRSYHYSGSDHSCGERWYIENPLTGMDVAQGSYKIHHVKKLFSSAYWTLLDFERMNTDDSPWDVLFQLQECI